MKLFEEGKKKLLVILIIVAVVFVALYAIVNRGEISSLFANLTKVFTPVIIGAGLAYVLNPILRFFEFKVYKKIKSKNVLRALSITSTFVITVVVIAAFLFMFVPSLMSGAKDLASNYNEYLDNTAALLNEYVQKIFKTDMVVLENGSKIIEKIKDFLQIGDQSAVDFVISKVASYAGGLFSGVTDVILGIFIAVYMLISKEKLQAQARKIGNAMLSEKAMGAVTKYVSITHKTFLSYFAGKILSSLCIMVIMLTLMTVFKLPYPFVVSAIIGITDIIPIFGPFLGAIPSFLIIFIVDPADAILFIILILVVQQIEGNIISPKILGDKTGISSLSVIIAILVMGEYFGIVGMIIGVPVFAVGIMIAKEIIETRLLKKGKSTELADYYSKDDVIDPHRHRIPLLRRLVYRIEHAFKHGKKKNKPKKENAYERFEHEENTEAKSSGVTVEVDNSTETTENGEENNGQ